MKVFQQQDSLGESKFKVIFNEEDHYVLEREDGSYFKAHKIDTEKISKRHLESVRKVAEKLPPERVMFLVRMLQDVLNNEPTITEYLEIANDLAENIQNCYDIVGRPNLFHHPFKNINPEIYGKAQTLRKEVHQLLETMWEVLEEHERNNFIQYVKTTTEEATRVVFNIKNQKIPYSTVTEYVFFWTEIA